MMMGGAIKCIPHKMSVHKKDGKSEQFQILHNEEAHIQQCPFSNWSAFVNNKFWKEIIRLVSVHYLTII
jgi:hypothetical protein